VCVKSILFVLLVVVSDLEGFQIAPVDRRDAIKKAQQLVADGKALQYRIMDVFGINDPKTVAEKLAAARAANTNTNTDAVGKRGSSFFRRFMTEMKQPIFAPSTSSSSSSSPHLPTKQSGFQWDVVLSDAEKRATMDAAAAAAADVPVNLNDMPDEVLVHIFLNLPDRMRRTNRRVCKLWDEILKDDSLQSVLIRARSHVQASKVSDPPELEEGKKAVLCITQLVGVFMAFQEWETSVDIFMRTSIPATASELDLQMFRSLISLGRCYYQLVALRARFFLIVSNFTRSIHLTPEGNSCLYLRTSFQLSQTGW
jgi:hypothetical protein